MAQASQALAFKNQWFPWLGRFLDVRKLDWPDGRALFRYRCRDAEFESLPAVIEQKLGSKDRDDGKGALLCLYVAEWWRRHFEGGPWKWEGPLRALGGRAAEMAEGRANKLRSDLIIAGLGWWQRRTLPNESNYKEYLGTLATEGGLPLQLLAGAAQSKVQDFLEKLVGELAGRDLRALKSIAGDSAKCLELGRNHQGALPATMRKADAVPQLGAELAAGIVLLDEEVRLLRSARRRHRWPDAREWLHLVNQVPDWQARLPVELQAEGVWPLVEILRKQSRITRRRARTERPGWLGWVWRLQKTANGWRKVRTFEVEGVDGRRMADLCGQAVKTRVQVFASADGSPARLLGDLYIQRDGTWDFDERGQLPAELWGTDLDVEVTAPGLLRRPAEVTPAGLDEGLPWLFAEEDGELVLVGQGKSQTSADHAWLSVPSGMSVRPSGREADAIAVAEVLGRGAPGLVGRSWWRIERGTVRVGERWSVACRSTRVDPLAPNFCGQVLKGAADPWPAYRGFPRLSAEDWDFHVRGADGWRPVTPADRVGVFQTRLVGPEGETVPGRRLHVVPRDLRIYDSAHGLAVETGDLDAVWGGLDEQDAQHSGFVFAREGGRFSIDLPTPDEGAIYWLELRAAGADKVVVRWPVPAPRPILLDRAGQRMADPPEGGGPSLGPVVPLGRLVGHRLRATVKAGESLRVRLSAGGEALWVESEVALEAGLIEMGLDLLEVAALRLLAAGASEEACIEVEAWSGNQAESRRFCLKPATSRLQLQGQHVLGPPSALVSAWSITRCGDEPRPLERLDEYGTTWQMPADLESKETWVIQAQDANQECEAWPLTWPVAEIGSADPIRKRFQELSGLPAKDLARDLDWLDAVVEKLEDLPAGSLGAGRMLAEFPSVAVALLLSTYQDPERMRCTLTREGLELVLVGVRELVDGIHLAWRRLRFVVAPLSVNLRTQHGMKPLAEAIEREQAHFPVLQHAVRVWRAEALQHAKARAWAETIEEPPNMAPAAVQQQQATTDLAVEGWSAPTRKGMSERAVCLLKEALFAPHSMESRRLRQVPEWLARVLVGHDPALTSAQRLRLLAFRDRQPGWFDTQVRLAISLKPFTFSWPEATRPTRPEAP